MYNPIWRQGRYQMPFLNCLSVTQTLSMNTTWTYETVILAHIILSGPLLLAAHVHWTYWDIDVFITQQQLALDLLRIFSIHLTLSALLCSGFGSLHLTGFYGPGMWSSDILGICGTVTSIKPILSFNLTPNWYSVIPSHHIFSGPIASAASLWHSTSRPGPFLYNTTQMGNIEEVLAHSIPPVFFSTIIVSSAF